MPSRAILLARSDLLSGQQPGSGQAATSTHPQAVSRPRCPGQLPARLCKQSWAVPGYITLGGHPAQEPQSQVLIHRQQEAARTEAGY